MKKAKKQIKEIKEEEKKKRTKIEFAFMVSLLLAFLLVVYFVAFLLFGGEVNNK